MSHGRSLEAEDRWLDQDPGIQLQRTYMLNELGRGGLNAEQAYRRAARSRSVRTSRLRKMPPVAVERRRSAWGTLSGMVGRLQSAAQLGSVCVCGTQRARGRAWGDAEHGSGVSEHEASAGQLVRNRHWPVAPVPADQERCGIRAWLARAVVEAGIMSALGPALGGFAASSGIF